MKFLLFLAFWLSQISCDPELEPTLAQVRKLEGGNRLIEQVLEEGSISIRKEKEFPFEAYWDSSRRIIGIASDDNEAYALLFELHNAASQKTFDQYNALAKAGKISKNEYVRMVETLEYENTLKTAALIDEGVQRGIFSPNSKVPYHAQLENHLQDQKTSGHSAWIGDIYDSLS